MFYPPISYDRTILNVLLFVHLLINFYFAALHFQLPYLPEETCSRPVPSAYGPRAQISNHGMAHALLLYKVARGQRIDIYYLESWLVLATKRNSLSRYGDRWHFSLKIWRLFSFFPKRNLSTICTGFFSIATIWKFTPKNQCSFKNVCDVAKVASIMWCS